MVGIAVPAASLSGVSVTIDPDASGTLSLTTTETTGAFNIPAGCVWVNIRNAGFVQTGDVEANATVAGSSWSPGREEKFEATRDSATGEFLTLPAIAGNGNGSRVFITYAT